MDLLLYIEEKISGFTIKRMEMTGGCYETLYVYNCNVFYLSIGNVYFTSSATFGFV